MLEYKRATLRLRVEEMVEGEQTARRLLGRLRDLEKLRRSGAVACTILRHLHPAPYNVDPHLRSASLTAFRCCEVGCMTTRDHA